jgi:mannose-6-phosphate isomerase-like protein (cupin superfamily)
MLNYGKWAVIAALVAVTVPAAYAQAENEPQAGDPDAKSLVEMEREWAEVCVTHDVNVLERILADDFLGTNTDGKLYTKSDDIRKIRSSTKRFVSGRLNDVKVRFFGSDMAVLHGVETCLRKTNEGTEEPETAVWTDTWLKRKGRWQIVAAQDAAVPAMLKDDSKVIFVSARQLNSQVHEAPEVGPGVSRIDLSEYNSSKGGTMEMRRTKPYRAEVHKRLTDIWFVTAGGGTLVTGGSLVEPVQTDADEFRGPGITGGQKQHIAQGDFVRIPAGVPHWISSIDGEEILYLVVKTASSEPEK